MNEYKMLKEVHEIRERIHNRTKNLSPEELQAYWDRRNSEIEVSLAKMGLKFAPASTPGYKIIVSIDS
ncbi:MAG: hypothetical protein FWD49_04685 [Firmicutes bacterium]|nr:hypothetical protein [Bacillota bacterium]